MALSGRRKISLYLRRWAGALLLAAARASRHSAGALYARGSASRGPQAQRMRAVWHDLLRPSDCDALLIPHPSRRSAGRHHRAPERIGSGLGAPSLGAAARLDVPARFAHEAFLRSDCHARVSGEGWDAGISSEKLTKLGDTLCFELPHWLL